MKESIVTGAGNKANINYYNKLIEDKKVELDKLIDIRDKLIESLDQDNLAFKK